MLERPEEGVPLRDRPTDDERDNVLALLRSHCADGSLTLDEFADQVGLVLQARTRDELIAVAAEVGAVPEPQPRERTSLVVGVMCSGIRKGRWRPAPRVKARAVWGGCHLDFRAAELPGQVVEVSAFAMMGGITIVVPEGVHVEVYGRRIMGGVHRRVRDVPVLPGTPVIRVRALAVWGGVVVKSKPSRRNEQRGLGRDDRRRPLLDEALPAGSSEVAPDGTVTILFSDIENFTGLTERLGDLRAQSVLRAHNEIVRREVAAHGGREVKAQGDSFMVSFSGARRALRCAIAVQRALAAWSAEHPDEPVCVRIGLHTGEAINEDDDLFGRSVILAARIADAAEGGTILVSSLLKELAQSSGEFRFGPSKSVTLKGLAGEHFVHTVEWA